MRVNRACRSIKPNDTCRQIKSSKEHCGALIVSRCNCAALFQVSEEVLDQMASFVEMEFRFSRGEAFGFLGNHGGDLHLLKPSNDAFLGVVSFVGDQGVFLTDLLQKRVCTLQILGIAG